MHEYLKRFRKQGTTMAVKYYESPLGWIEIQANEQTITQIKFVAKNEQNFSNPVIENFIKELNLYFQKGISNFSFPFFWNQETKFQTQVYRALLTTKTGQVYTYKQIAQKCKSPLAYRAVGNANNKNKLPIVIPCHRVVATSKKNGGYAFGLDVKRALLNIEKKQFSFLKLKLKNNISFEKLQLKCKRYPFYEINKHAVSYVLHKEIINVREGNKCLYVNFQNLDSDLVKKDLVRRFNLDVNYDAILKYFANSPFKKLMEKFQDEHEVFYNDFYQAIVTIIIHQFISTKAAFAIAKKYCKKFGTPIENHYLFPSSHKIAKLPLQKIQKIGLTENKAVAIQTISKLVSNSQINLANSDEVIEILRKIKGIGNWTIENLKLFAYKMPNAWPATDLGIKVGLQMYLNKKEPISEKKLDLLKLKYKKYSSYLILNIWNYFSSNKT